MVRIGDLMKTGYEMTACDDLENQFDTERDALVAMVKTAEHEINVLRREIQTMIEDKAGDDI